MSKYDNVLASEIHIRKCLIFASLVLRKHWQQKLLSDVAKKSWSVGWSLFCCKEMLQMRVAKPVTLFPMISVNIVFID
jgi:hypothetical protein